MTTLTAPLWHVTLPCGATALAAEHCAEVWCCGCGKPHAWDACEARPL